MDERGRVIEDILKIKKRLDERKRIDSFLEGKITGSYTINSDLTVDVEGDVHLYAMGLTKIPIKFGKVTGDFGCHKNELESLEGCPYWVGRRFACWENKLKTLEHCPLHVVGDMFCEYNLLTTLSHAPKKPFRYEENPCAPIYDRLGAGEAHIQCRKVWI